MKYKQFIAALSTQSNHQTYNARMHWKESAIRVMTYAKGIQRVVDDLYMHLISAVNQRGLRGVTGNGAATSTSFVLRI
jgi:hypothetical protein